MEFVGEFGGIRFYNDSIATIPEAVIYALKQLAMWIRLYSADLTGELITAV
jgi:UDP-N-acetylmuramoylalanine-D-glutamate ligase